MLKKSKQTSVKSPQKNLSIQFSLDGFSFCISDAATKAYILFTEYVFERAVTTPELLLAKITTIFNDDKELQADFQKIEAIHVNNLSTVVPDAFFSKTNLKSYLDYTVKTLVNDHVVFDDLPSINAKNVYIPFVNINNYLFQHFGSFEFKHHSSVLIHKIIAYSKSKTEKEIFVHVLKNTIDVVVTEGKKLSFYNSFSFSTKEDFIYYILFVAEQLDMDPNTFQLTFLGLIDADAATYKMAYTYIRNINFIPISSDFFADTEDFSNHANFLLVS